MLIVRLPKILCVTLCVLWLCVSGGFQLVRLFPYLGQWQSVEGSQEVNVILCEKVLDGLRVGCIIRRLVAEK